MLTKNFYFLVVVFMVTWLVTACDSGQKPETQRSAKVTDEKVIYATNYPIYFFAQKIAGDTAAVQFPQIEGDPANWQPSLEEILNLQKADLILLNGAGYESWLDKVTLASHKLVVTTRTKADSYIITDQTVHSHGPEGDHSHNNHAFTTWLDMDIAQAQAQVIFDELAKLMPKHKSLYQQNLNKLLEKLSAYERQLQAEGKRLNEKAVLFSHPVYQYLQAKYQLNGRSLHWEPEQVLDASALRVLAKLNRSHQAQWLLWEDQPTEEIVQLLEQKGVSSVVFNPSGNRGELDFYQQMEANIKALASIN